MNTFTNKCFADNEIIWITMINHGYVNYTKNFLEAMKKCGANFTLVVYCLDAGAFRDLINNCLCLPILATDTFLKGRTLALATGLTEWLQEDYKRIVFSKLDAILYTLQQTTKSVGYIDTDIWLFKDPDVLFREVMKKTENQDIWVFSQCDEQGLCTNTRRCSNLCSGVMVMRNQKEIYPMLAYTAADVKNFYGDQQFLTHKFQQNNVPYLTLDKKLLMNGGSVPHLQTKKVTFHADCCLIHFNYMIGSAKQKSMQLQGLWHV